MCSAATQPSPTTSNYSCALLIRHAETDRLTTFQCQDTCTTEVPTSLQPSEIPISLIAPSAVGGVFIILFVVLIPVIGIILRRCRQRPLPNHQQDHIDPQPNAHPPLAQPLRQQSPGTVINLAPLTLCQNSIFS